MLKATRGQNQGAGAGEGTGIFRWQQSRGVTAGATRTESCYLGRYATVIDRREDGKCDCGIIQNTAHILQCLLIAEETGRTAELEEIWGGPE